MQYLSMICYNLIESCNARKPEKLVPNRSKTHCTAQILQLMNFIGVITGHWSFGKHAGILNIQFNDFNDFFRSCQDEEEDEMSEHLYCHYP